MILIVPHKGNQVVLESDNICHLNLVREHFSVPNPARRGNMIWMPARLFIISPLGKVNCGNIPEIVKFLDQYPIPYQIDPRVKERLHPKSKIVPENLLKLDREYRDYQAEAIKIALRRSRGVIRVATSGGKTFLMAGLILNWFPKKTLVVVPTAQLVEQTYKDFVEYGLQNVSKWSGTNPLNSNSDIIISNTQILLSGKTDLNFLERFDLVLCDECHVYNRGNQCNKIFKYLSTPNIFGFTGTLPPNKIDEWNVIGEIGPVIFEEGVKSLMAKGFVSNFEVIMIELLHKNPPKAIIDITKPTKAYLDEMKYLMDHSRRNDIISKLVIQLKTNTLIMVDRLEYGSMLEKLIKTKTIQPVHFIKGEMELEEREDIRSKMNERNDVIVIAMAKIFSTGINMPQLTNILIIGGKSFIRIIQSIGRSLRLHPTKTRALIFDISDNTRYSKKHAVDRVKIYEKEEYPYKIKKIQI